MKDDKVVFKRMEGREELYELFALTVEKMLQEGKEKANETNNKNYLLH